MRQQYSLQPLNVCELCFSPLDVSYDYKALAGAMSREEIARGPHTMWLYRDFLPVDSKEVDISTGYTPLIRAYDLGCKLGLEHLCIKNDCLNQTYSF